MNPGIRKRDIQFKNMENGNSGKRCLLRHCYCCMDAFFPSNLEKEAAGKFCRDQATLYR
jgi:hypothetical protein